MRNPPLILASASPRRQAILRSLGVAFHVATPPCEEMHDANAPAVTVMENAYRKAIAAQRLFPKSGIIAADTLVAFRGKALGKPASEAEGKAWLRAYAGEQQQVYTAVAFCLPEVEAVTRFTEVSALTFRQYDEATVERYWALVNPIDRAGAYDINAYGDLLIEKYTGSYTNIMGLPRELVRQWLLAHRLLP